jgi:hypothetical protein
MESAYLSVMVSGSVSQLVQERLNLAERDALVRQARLHRPLFGQIRLAVGQFMVSSGKWVAGRPRRKTRSLEIPTAYKLAR